MMGITGACGWVNILDSGESYGDINISVSINDLNNMLNHLKEILKMNLNDQDFKVFAIDWYNGSDCPLKF